MDVIKETKYLLFVVGDNRGKTKVINIINIHHHEVIGEIKWFTKWRQYCFFPYNQTIWNKTCMEDVYKVIHDLMEERKETAKTNKL